MHRTKVCVVLTIELLSLLLSTQANAHSAGLSRSDWSQASADGPIHASFYFAAADVRTMERSRDIVAHGVEVERGERCTSAEPRVMAVENDGFRVDVDFDCRGLTANSVQLQVNVAGLIDAMSTGHRHLVGDHVVLSSNPTISFIPSLRREMSALAMISTGVEHILTGLDHILFVIVLMLGLGTLRSTTRAITAFTVGHSVTLFLTCLTHQFPSPHIIEPMIALSIVAVAVNNMWASYQSKRPAGRWVVALVFGLLHGLGFAGALADIAVTETNLPAALVGFNVGVEVGQLVIVVPAMVALALLAKRPRLAQMAIPVLSGLIALPGAFWFVARLLEASGPATLNVSTHDKTENVLATSELAHRLCLSLHTVPADRLTTCQSKAGVNFGSECDRSLAASVASGAASLVESEVDACEQAMRTALHNCADVASSPLPLPSACVGVVHGKRQRLERCRSSLECQADLVCQSGGPSEFGTCQHPAVNGTACGLSVDTLATYTRQPIDEAHPECQGMCNRRARRCASNSASTSL